MTAQPTTAQALDEVRIEFETVKTLDPTPTTPTTRLVVYNLSQKTIDRICGA